MVTAAASGVQDEADPARGGVAAFSTPDPDEAKVRTEELLQCSHRMAVLDRARGFRAGVSYLSMAGFGLMSSTYGAPVEIACAPPIPWVTVSIIDGGTATFTRPGADTTVVGAARGAVLAYERPVAMRWSPGARQLMVTIPKARVEAFLRRLLARPLRQPLRFEPGLDLDSDGRGVASAVATLRRAAAACGRAGPPPVLAGEVEHSMISALLLAHRHNYTDAIFAPQPVSASRVVGRVVEFMESASDTAVTAADLAAFAGVSERSLYAAFRRQFDASPMAYLRRLRLDRAHEDLVCAEPTGASGVTEIALRHGFAHGGRFAAAYRARFGEAPSQTLRR
ncbi:MAG TPA: AraC family transcriptional regulator [Acidimicrobiales bacterium]|nr:AraC family transcriptional regulator [Acidimicrobiales bacterium]